MSEDYKLPPEDYKQLLDSCELESISLVKSSALVKRENISEGLSISISEGANFVNTDAGFESEYAYTIRATNKSKKQAIRLTCTFLVSYLSTEDITEDFFEIYKDLSLPFIVWPFFREYVYSQTSRMSIPPLTLPQIRRG